MDKKAVTELPMRMVVTLVIGGVALGSVTYYLTSNCWSPENIQVSWSPEVLNEGSNTLEVKVADGHGKPIKNAIVTVVGLGTASSNKTGSNGEVRLHINPILPKYRNEGYLSIQVKAGGCYRDFTQSDAIKVVKR